MQSTVSLYAVLGLVVSSMYLAFNFHPLLLQSDSGPTITSVDDIVIIIRMYNARHYTTPPYEGSY